MYEESRDTFYYIDINWDNMASAAYLAPGPSRLRRTACIRVASRV